MVNLFICIYIYIYLYIFIYIYIYCLYVDKSKELVVDELLGDNCGVHFPSREVDILVGFSVIL